MARNLIAFLLLQILVLSACGGGGSASQGGGGGTPGGPTPQLASILPSSVAAGANDLTIRATGSGFGSSSKLEWNAEPLATTFVNDTELTAIVPASKLTTAGTIQVRVSNVALGGGTSAAMTFTIGPALTKNTWARVLNYVPNDIAWDATHGKLYATIGAADQENPNTILVINPFTGTVESKIETGADPHLLSVSGDGSFLYVGLNGISAVQRYTLPDFRKDITILLPLGVSDLTQHAASLEVARNSPRTVAIVAGRSGYSPSGWNVYIFDDAIMRPNSLNVLIGPGIDWLQWGKDDSMLYGMQHTTIDAPGGVLRLSVTPDGLSILPENGGFPGGGAYYSYFSPETGLMYSSLVAADPETHAQTGIFTILGDQWQCVPDGKIGRYYCVVGPETYGHGAELWVYDIKTFNLIERDDLARVITGVLGRTIRWGTSGLASIGVPGLYNGNGGLFLIDGAAVNPNVPPDTSSGSAARTYPLMKTLSPESAPVGSTDITVTITGGDFGPNDVGCWHCNFLPYQTVPTTYVSPTEIKVKLPASAMQAVGPQAISVYNPETNTFGTNSLTFTVLPAAGTGSNFAAMNLDGLALAWDKTRALLYVGTGGNDRAYPSNIVAVDPATATVKLSKQVNSFPYLLSMSAQDQYLYVGFWKASLETQLVLPGLTTAHTWPLKNPDFVDDNPFGNQFYAGDLQAAPQDPHTSVVTLYNYAYTPWATGGVAIHDDQVQRPNIVPGWMSGNDINTLAWGKTDSILMGSQNEEFGLQEDYLFNVDAMGVTLAHKERTTFNDAGALIHSDFGTGLVYSDDGNVADPSTGQILGSIDASGIVVPDSTLNRIFVLGQTQSQQNTTDFTIASFDETTYQFVSTKAVPKLLGTPIGMSKCGTHCLAIITFNPDWGSYSGPVGMLYLITDSTFVSGSGVASNTSPRALGIDVKVRWKALSRSEVLQKHLNKNEQ